MAIYDEKEMRYLKRVDKKLAIGQQISTKAHQTIWARMIKELREITPVVIDVLSVEQLQQFGITFRKASYIKSVAQIILTNEFDINTLHSIEGMKDIYR